nr:hypothetical protein [Tolivirales sp.]
MEGSLGSNMAGTGVGPDYATTKKRLTSERDDVTNCIVIRNVCVTPTEKRKLPPLYPETDMDFIDRSREEKRKYDRLNAVVSQRAEYIDKIKHFEELPDEETYNKRSNDFVPIGFTQSRAMTNDYVKETAFQLKANQQDLTPHDTNTNNLPIKKRISKSANVLGYLRRKGSVLSTTIRKSSRPKESAFKEYNSQSTQVMNAVADDISNRFNVLTDTMADTPDDDDDMEEVNSIGGASVTSNQRAVVAEAQPAPPPDPEDEKSWHDIIKPSFAKARALRDKKTRKVYTALTYHLKCKHFMHSRDPHFVRTLVQDARAWMTRQKLPTESYLEYAVLTSAVAAAFFVDQEELDFRARMKNRTEWQAIDKLNKAMTGDLGHRLFPVKPILNGVRHVFQSHVRFPPTNIASV